MYSTLIEYLDHWTKKQPNDIWLRQPKGEVVEEWSWQQASEQIHAIAAWQQQTLGGPGVNVGLLSRNRPHWFMADLASIAAGNATVPMFTTLPRDTAEYVMDFTDMQLLFVGETENWEKIEPVLPEGITLVTLPGVDLAREHLRWDDLVAAHHGQRATHSAQADDLISIVFTSGTTGMPKGVMQSHAANIVPVNRFKSAFDTPANARLFSYLPLSHIAERQVVEFSSVINGGSVYFNENMTTLLRDLQACRPHLLFGPPRVWEQLQQGIIAQFGSQDALEAALAKDKEATGKMVRDNLGLNEAMYLLTAAAPTPPALIHWYSELGIELMEGFGQTEAMGVSANTREHRKIGSIGRAVEGVEVRLSEESELLIRATGLAAGYYKMPEKTAETFVDGWLHTGDKARIDEDGFIYITGRVKDYFKTIQGKFVAPTAIENEFAKSPHSEQCCLLGRGYSKTVIVCVLSELAQKSAGQTIDQDLIAQVEQLNQTVEKHARVGAIIVSREPWTIDNGMLTPTMKIRREQVEEQFGEQARQLAQDAAVQRKILLVRE
ncbi:MAG: AMP-binding protein [Gammaproteobacteria bacterium]|nr:AMP-binding protein [Gammaproteobacteria bacterium]